MTIHPVYSLAMLKLWSAFDQTSTVGLYCFTSDTSLSAMDERAVIVGWGDILHCARNDSNVLLRAALQMKSDLTKCSSSIQNTINPILFCDSYSSDDICQGDYGGPFLSSD
jgi:hypothetical protein